MSKKQKKDKLVLENLDRIVAGEKLQDQAELDDDTRKALELTRELSSWPKSPSKEFETELKARLTHQLAEQEKLESPVNDIETWGILHRPKWQLTVAAIILVLILAIITIIILLATRVL